jgi:catechol 2,3-dioxygenase-like lactoylglutathione lyase family enzyme
MAIKRMDHVSVVVDDLPAAIAFFTTLGMALEGEMPVEGPWVDRLCGLEGVQVDIAMMRTPDGHGRVELTKFRNPELVGAEPAIAPPNTLGLRQIMFAVEDIDDTVARLRATAPNSSARWPSTRTSTGSATCEALRASSSRWPRNSADAFTLQKWAFLIPRGQVCRCRI